MVWLAVQTIVGLTGPRNPIKTSTAVGHASNPGSDNSISIALFVNPDLASGDADEGLKVDLMMIYRLLSPIRESPLAQIHQPLIFDAILIDLPG